ncbi:MAG: hypothetical protein HQ579_08655 [Candidatus Omnitrophica bacterium]|nr:hypothetical protein [Candidatus Omnitrophota bacterium]
MKKIRLYAFIFSLISFSVTQLVCVWYAGAAEGAHFKYDSHERRDPFVPLVGLARRGSGAIIEIVSIDDVEFQGIANDSEGQSIVIINGEMLKEGAKLYALEVISISDREAVVTVGGRKYTLSLYEKEVR